MLGQSTILRGLVVALLFVSVSVAMPGGTRTAAGAPVKSDPSNPSVLAAATFAVDAIDAESNGEFRFDIIKVNSVYTQIVSGIKYIIRFSTAETNCKKGNTWEECKAANGEVTHTDQLNGCEVHILDQSWISPRYTLLSATCKPLLKSGEISHVEPSDAKVMSAARFAVEDFNTKSNSMFRNELIKVNTVSSQVVAGINYFMRFTIAETNCMKGTTNDICKTLNNEPKTEIKFVSCDVTVWDQEWRTPRYELVDMKCRNLLEQGGHEQDADVSDVKVISAAAFAVEDMNMMSNSMYRTEMIKINKVTKQVVAGIKYNMIFTIAETNCMKGTTNDICKTLNNEPKTEIHLKSCEVAIWEQEWRTPKYSMVDMQCKNLLKTGSKTHEDANADNVVAAANFAIKDFNTKSNTIFRTEIIKINKVSTQLVSGMKYEMIFTIANTNCVKGTEDSVCKTMENAPKMTKDFKSCEVTVLEQAWMTPKYQVSDMQCKNLLKTGEKNHEDATADNVVAAANFAIKDFNTKSNTIFRTEIIKINKVSTQVVAGIKYDMIFTIANTNCVKGTEDAVCKTMENAPKMTKAFQSCEITVLEQAWMTPKYQLTGMTCRPLLKSENELETGTPIKVDPTDESVTVAAAFAVKDFNAKSNSMYRTELIKVHSVSKQVVAGMKYSMIFTIAHTNCMKGSNDEVCKTLNNEPKAEIQLMSCKVNILEQAWKSPRFHVTEMNCTPLLKAF